MTELNATERAVAELWCEALQVADSAGAADNFFAPGGDSMTITTLEFRVMEELNVQVPAGSSLNAQTLREFSALIDAARPQSASAGG